MRSFSIIFGIVLVAVVMGASAFTGREKQAIPASIVKTPLTGKKWELKEIRFLQDNVPFYYNRDERYRNTTNFDGDYIIFHPDGSGLYHQGDGLEYKVDWKYTSEDNSTIEFINHQFRHNKDLVVRWEHIAISGNQVSYSEYYTHADGVHSLAYGTRESREKSCPSDDQSLQVTKN